ncbi:MAG TPA: DeoR/GlpR family DNA-binding transcription regulator [Beutenbergiaceae bacterium]|nr:DeoR/GlpR family DNA-binding transcription regulator [Beutenbergiaceae bacterium]
MLAATRRARLGELVRERASVHNEDVARELGVSVETVRRDLEHLDRTGEVVRVHGGAIAPSPVLNPRSEPAFDDRLDLAAGSKRAIGTKAAGLLAGASTIFLDIGTTIAQLATAIDPDLRATVVTPSMRVAELLSAHRNLTVLVPGGAVRPGDLVISGATAVQFLADIYADVAFLGSGGVSVQRGLTDYEHAEVAIKRTMLANCDRSFVLADSTKFARTAPYRVCGVQDVTAFITDRALPAAQQDQMHDAEVGVIVA